jgi:protein-disulfide isomerase
VYATDSPTREFVLRSEEVSSRAFNCDRAATFSCDYAEMPARMSTSGRNIMNWFRPFLIATAALGLGICPGAFAASGTGKSKAITRQQANKIFDELSQIHALLEKMQEEQALRDAASAPAAERVKLKIDDSYAVGRKDAPVTLVEFADYQCPYCRQFHTTAFEQLRKNYIDTGKLRFVAMDLPLSMHPDAVKAAQAALCAGEQFKFWEMRDLLVAHSNNLGEDAILGNAEELHLDEILLRTCLDSNKYEAKVKGDVAQADAVGINGTPSFVLGRTQDKEIEGLKLVGTLSYSRLETLIQGVLSAQPSADKGPAGGK